MNGVFFLCEGVIGRGWRDLNSRHKDYDSSALTPELHRHSIV
jgi:hypothetical protein